MMIKLENSLKYWKLRVSQFKYSDLLNIMPELSGLGDS